MSEMVKVTALLAILGASIAIAQESRLQDPMRPHVAQESGMNAPAAEQAVTLTAVLVSQSRRVAVINNRIFRVGDRINGDEIVRIEPGSIEIRRGNKLVRFTLAEERPTWAGNDGERSQ